MSGLSGISAYQQMNQTWNSQAKGAERASENTASKTGQNEYSKASASSEIKTKGWSPLETGSSLIPRSTSEYGNVIGDVQLSDKAKEYYNQLKAKFHNMEFIAVSNDMKSAVAQNAAAYGNAQKQVVLIDAEKLERMANDESFRNKYEGIIAMSQSKLLEAKNSLASSGANVKNFGMSVDSNGNESFFATVEKSQDLQKARIEKKAAEKKELKAKEQKQAQKEAQEERIRKRRENNKAEKNEASDKTDNEPDDIDETDTKEYLTIEASSMDELLAKVSSYGYDSAVSRVMTDTERMMGTQIDYKG